MRYSTMTRLLLAGLLLAATTLRAGEVVIDGRTLVVPDGFTVERVAGPPLVDRPIVADFDEQGRLYVADSSGSNDKVEKQLAEKPHRIVRLEDTDGDGVFDRSVVFADRMMFPEGAMWYAGSLYVAAPPSIWKLTDTDGDGVADRREEWFQGKTLTGCANDLHGPYLGPDGWIYWCKGAFAEQTYERAGKPPLVTKAAHIFRARPDGTGIEPVMTGGMDNPVDVVFTPGGERIFTTTFLQHPGGGKRDGLIHAIYGGVYGKVHNVLDNHPWTGPEVMPVLVHMGPAAPCGLTRYESDVFGPEYRDNLFACQFNLHKVSRHVLKPKGATFEATSEDFFTSPDTDFHPTDVIEDADGSLLVIDTGGWYKLCCPSSHFHKPDILGAIYRIRKKDARKVEDPRGRALEWAKADISDLTERLSDTRPAVRNRAVNGLADKLQAIAPAWPGMAHGLIARAQGKPTEHVLNALWAATRVDSDHARQFVRVHIDDEDETVRQAAIHSAGLWRDKQAVTALIGALHRPSAQNRRAAAEALGRIGDPSAVPSLLGAFAAADPADRALEHSLIYALIEIGDPAATARGMATASYRMKHASLVALDQMGGDRLEPNDALSLLGSHGEQDPIWMWVMGRHPGWGDRLSGLFHGRLRIAHRFPDQMSRLEDQVVRFAQNPAIQAMLVRILDEPAESPEVPKLVLRIMARSGLKQTPHAWISAVIGALSHEDAEVQRQAAATLRAVPIPEDRAADVTAALLKLADRNEAVRLDALAALPGGLRDATPARFAFLVSRLSADQPVAVRATAADVLAKAKLSNEQLAALTEALAEAGPIEVTRLLPAFEKSSDEAVGRKLVEALRKTPGQSALRVDLVRPILEQYGEAVRPQAEELYSSLNAELAQQKAKLEATLAALQPGDVRRGQAIFNGQKAACSTCHAIGYVGGRIGPDLTKVASIRTDRDLLESILFPSATLVRSYEPVVVATADGRVFNGLVQEDTPEGLHLVTGLNQDMRISRSVIDEIRPGTVSIMPAGLDQQLSPQELADLIAFLKTCK
jgi:putative membrane-bound dehydrogenase-like protein